MNDCMKRRSKFTPSRLDMNTASETPGNECSATRCRSGANLLGKASRTSGARKYGVVALVYRCSLGESPRSIGMPLDHSVKLSEMLRAIARTDVNMRK